jgi:hypothetical protein
MDTGQKKMNSVRAYAENFDQHLKDHRKQGIACAILFLVGTCFSCWWDRSWANNTRAIVTLVVACIGALGGGSFCAFDSSVSIWQSERALKML